MASQLHFHFPGAFQVFPGTSQKIPHINIGKRKENNHDNALLKELHLIHIKGKNCKLYDSVSTINVPIEHIFIEILTTLFQGMDK